jgi:thymidylate synthase
MSEMGRNLFEMGVENHPNTYQNKHIGDDPQFNTKELMCEQYCLSNFENLDFLFYYNRNKEWALKEFEERIDRDHYPVNPGEAYKLRGEVWNQFLNDANMFDYSYNERFWESDIINSVANELERNPQTRQAIIPIFHQSDIQYVGGHRRIPCSMYYMFMVRADSGGLRYLHMTYHQRSSDFITHFGNDVFLAIQMLKWMSHRTGYHRLGNFYHTIDSLHAYRKDWDKLKETLPFEFVL